MLILVLMFLCISCEVNGGVFILLLLRWWLVVVLFVSYVREGLWVVDISWWEMLLTAISSIYINSFTITIPIFLILYSSFSNKLYYQPHYFDITNNYNRILFEHLHKGNNNLPQIILHTQLPKQFHIRIN